MNDGLINIDFNTEQKSDVRKKEVVCNLWRFLWDCHSVRVESYRIVLGSSIEVFVLEVVVIFANREQNSKSLFNREVIFNRIYVCPIW